MSKNFDETECAGKSCVDVRLRRFGRKTETQRSARSPLCDDSDEHVGVRCHKKSVVLSTERESKRRQRKDASVMSRVAGVVVELGLPFSFVTVSGQIFSSKVDFADFSSKP